MGMPDSRSPAPLGWPWSIVPAQCFATNEMAFARDIATSVCFLHEGRILEQGPPAQIFSEPREERTRQFLRRVLPG